MEGNPFVKKSNYYCKLGFKQRQQSSPLIPQLLKNGWFFQLPWVPIIHLILFSLRPMPKSPPPLPQYLLGIIIHLWCESKIKVVKLKFAYLVVIHIQVIWCWENRDQRRETGSLTFPIHAIPAREKKIKPQEIMSNFSPNANFLFVTLRVL